jgi:hypothetical protein
MNELDRIGSLTFVPGVVPNISWCEKKLRSAAATQVSKRPLS